MTRAQEPTDTAGRTRRPTRFTIVTPSLNQAATLRSTLASVLSQDGAFELEYIVVDGGSTDGSVEMIRSVAEQVAAGAWPVRCLRASLTWLSEPDGGQAEAINKGLRLATGDVVAWLNSDDTYLPGALEAVRLAFDDDADVSFVHGDGLVVDAQGDVSWVWRSRPYDQRVMTTYHFLWNNFTNLVMQQATFWRRQVHDRVGLLDETFHFAMDAEYWIRASAAGLRFRYLPRELATFRMAEGTKTMSSPTVFWVDYLEIFRRHRGAAAMAPYFGYYYYNLALHRDFDVERAVDDGRAVFDRWSALDPSERAELAAQSVRGVGLAWLLTARAALRVERVADAGRAFRKGVVGRPTLLRVVAGAAYGVNRLLGRRGRAWLSQLESSLLAGVGRARHDVSQPAARAGRPNRYD